MVTFTVKRSEWMRGEPDSALARRVAGSAQYKRCCLGFYANQVCGLTDEQICNAYAPGGVAWTYPDRRAQWGGLLSGWGQDLENSEICSRIMETNDKLSEDSELREALLIALFAVMDITVHFVD